LDLKMSPQMAGFTAKLQGKGKPIAATMSAVIATTAAVITFMSGSVVDELAASDNVNWNGPVGVLDADYAHLVVVGKITGANGQDEYVAEAMDVRDPMLAPDGVLRTTTQKKTENVPRKVVTTLPRMWLSGVIWDLQNPVAMIDGLDLRVGDRIKGARVVEIRMDSVVLSFASKEYVLTVD